METQEDYYEDPDNVQDYDETRRHTTGGRRIADAEAAWINTFLDNEQEEECSVLDVGGGTGWFSRYLEQHGVNIHYLDPSPAMLREAQEKDGFHKIQGSGAHLPFTDNSVDYIISIRTAHVIPPDMFTDYVQEMTRVAEHGVLFDTFRKPSLAQGYHPLLQNPSTLYRDSAVKDAVDAADMTVHRHEKMFTLPYAAYMLAGRNGADSNLLNLVETSEDMAADTWLEDVFASISIWHLTSR